jgi:hypothetical protein
MHHTTPIGRLAWSHIVDPAMSLSNKPEWSAGLVLAEADSLPLMELVNKTIEDERKKNPVFPRTNDLLIFPYGPSMKKNEAGVKEREPGMLVWKFKRPCQINKKATGLTDNSPPLLFDSMGRPVKLPEVPSGSEGKMVFQPYPYNKAGNIGIGLQISGFQIVKLEKRAIELEAVEGGWTPEAEGAAGAPAADSLGAMLASGGETFSDDEIPF